MSVRNDSVDSPLFVVRGCDSSNDNPSRGNLEVRLVRTWNEPSASMNPASQALDDSGEVSSGIGCRLSDVSFRFR